MKNYMTLPAVGLLTLITACSTQPGAATERTTEQLQENAQELKEGMDTGTAEWNKERDEAAMELRSLREDLVRKKDGEQKRLDDGIKDPTKKAERAAHMEELSTNIARVDAAIAMVDGSNTRNWQKSKEVARNTADDTRSWIQREAEKVDRMTNADADGDGH